MDGQFANYISLKDAAVYCDHSPDYLNLLVRKGKLKALKIGRNWVTKKEWLESYLSANRGSGKLGGFISLKEAENFCAYSQDYLNLLVRKNRLKALKIGRNWVTKKEWLESYLETVGQKKIKHAATKIENSAAVAARVEMPEVIPSKKIGEAKNENQVFDFTVFNGGMLLLPEPFMVSRPAFLGNVPVPRKAVAQAVSAQRNSSVPAVVFLCLSMMASAIFIFGGYGSMQKTGTNIFAAAGITALSQAAGGGVAAMSAPIAAARGNLWEGTGQAFKSIGSAAQNAAAKFAGFIDYLFNGKTEKSLVREGSAVPVDETVLDKSLQALENNITSDTQGRFNEFRQEFGIPEDEKAPVGLVVVPSSGDEQNDAKIKEDIKKTFSDEVAVNPKDDVSGVVVPQFKDRPGDEYIYMMVPMPKTGNN